MPALDYMEKMHPRDHPDHRVRISPGIDAVTVVAEPGGTISLGPDANGQRHPMTVDAYNQLARILGVAEGTLRRAPPHETVGVLNYRLGLTSQPFLSYAVQNGIVTYWVNGGIVTDTTASLIQTAVEVLGSNLYDAVVAYAHDTLDKSRFNIFDPKIVMLPSTDMELVCMGISVQHSLSWTRPMRMSLYLHDPLTDHGAIVGDQYGKFFRKRTLDGQQWWPRTTMEKVIDTKGDIAMKLRQLHYFEIPDGEGLRRLVRSLFFDLKAPRDTRFALQEMVISRPPDNLYGIYKLVSEMGCDLDRLVIPTQRYKVLELAGNIANRPERCPSCFRGPV